jgi:hypothetical protein
VLGFAAAGSLGFAASSRAGVASSRVVAMGLPPFVFIICPR